MQNEDKVIQEIKDMLSKGLAQQAVDCCNKLIDSILENEDNKKQLAQLYYLRGNGFHRLGEQRKAMNSYLEAIDRDSQSPAKMAYNNIIEILDFYNHDLYNP